MYEFYKTIGIDKAKQYFKALESVYKDMPDTKGCLEHIDKSVKDGGCGGWCCYCQTPQIFYIEFLYCFEYIQKNMSDDDLLDIIEKSMLNAVKGETTKGCIFFDDETKMCKVHQGRSFNCRFYGITPDEEFNRRWSNVTKRMIGMSNTYVKKQCELVSTADGSEVSVEDSNKWWGRIYQLESQLGIKEENINDKEGGSYRTPHDHLLLYLLPENIVGGLAGIRHYDNYKDKVSQVNALMDILRDFYKK